MAGLRLDRINTIKLSGTFSILGVDLSRSGARVVELKSSGGIANKFKATYRTVNYFTIVFPADLSLTDRGRALAEELRKRKIRTRFCVSTIRSSNSRTVSAEIPSDVEDVQTWMAENYEKLVRVPIPLKELAFSTNVDSIQTDSIDCEIAFVRAAERDEIVELLQSAGLHLLGLGLGVRDSEAAAMISGEDFKEGNHGFVFLDVDEAACRIYEEGKPGPWKKLQPESLVQQMLSFKPDLKEITVAGPRSEEVHSDNAKVLKPLGLPPEYALSVGLAVRGFLPEIGSFDFSPDAVKKKTTEEKDKSLLKTTVLAFGSLLFVLLGLQFGIQSYLPGRLLQPGQ